jgi:hypothetical protein
MGVIIPGLYLTIDQITESRDLGNDNLEDPEIEDPDNSEAFDPNNSNQEDEDPTDPNSLGDDATMAHSRPDKTPTPPVDLEAQEKAKKQAKQDDAVF